MSDSSPNGVPVSEAATLHLDGAEVAIEPGETILDLCRREGLEVPTLCHDDRLEPYGGCRTCLVDLEGAPRPVPACKTKAAAGMKLEASSKGIEAIRATMMDMFAADKKKLIAAGHTHFEDRNRFIGFNPSDCILCDRCVRYCDEVMQCNALEHVGQGDWGFIQPTDGKSFLDTDCELCGGCVSTCPTGALYDKQTTHEPDKSTRTVCTYCGVGCVIDLETFEGKVQKITAEVGVGPNNGDLCNKGKFAWEFIHHDERLTQPLIRGEDGKLHPTDWDTALKKVAAGLSEVKEKYGPDALGFLASSRCTNEDVYAIQKLARAVIGTNNVHSCAAT